jgi:hypothetical protein
MAGILVWSPTFESAATPDANMSTEVIPEMVVIGEELAKSFQHLSLALDHSNIIQEIRKLLWSGRIRTNATFDK